jgi:hypothetical protein
MIRALALLFIFSLCGCAGMRPAVAPAGSDERCQSLELRYMVFAGLAASAGAFATGSLYPSLKDDSDDHRARWAIAQALAIAFGSGAMVISAYVDDLHEAEGCARNTQSRLPPLPLQPSARTSTISSP